MLLKNISKNLPTITTTKTRNPRQSSRVQTTKISFMDDKELKAWRAIAKLTPDQIIDLEKMEEWESLTTELDFSWKYFVKTSDKDRLNATLDKIHKYFVNVAKAYKKLLPPSESAKINVFSWACNKRNHIVKFVMTDKNVFFE